MTSIAGMQPSGISGPAGAAAGAAGGANGGGFMDSLQGAIQQVNQMQADAKLQVDDLLRGNGQDLHGAMLAVEKADLAFQFMMQVRNKIVQAYQEVAQMSF